MSLSTCAGCSTRYAAGLESCPHCGSAERAEVAGPMLPTIEAVCTTETCPAQGRVRLVVVRTVAVGVLGVPRLRCASCGQEMEEHMPKITRHGGASNAGAAGPRSTPPAAPDPQQDGGEQPSAGNSSSTLPARPPSSPETSVTGRPRRARTTASRSKKDPAESSTAPSTDTSGEAE